MSVDDFAKILIVIAISISLLGISYQTMRLIGVFADSIKDLRQVLQAFGQLSEKFVVDYDFISSRLKSTVDSISNFAHNVIDPLSKIFSFIGKFQKKKKTKKEGKGFDDVEVDTDNKDS